ncbi:hypothetical protein RAB80_015329 [Fusarium oxysporum f. sp. vasinfectum]|uniref:Transcription factor domain-containing protein n=1 Tax=Fusarium oxysporum f. sp. vasinfectum 25433 TaxID=1089449 RepID=X0KQD4_FUSOX|nr:hypothetical protein FOTG_15896 [Fusarium oxysporum f. sp. vasinfectum 25433]KAK2669803.1 hypothetical protein RAB80_015329 [Fusarium oxysporum f. sp. vasinfectum]KAK2925315.1 hypothetical protein FoTM2_015595 [Fusarium oxysporum f. sp. vasinfectum]
MESASPLFAARQIAIFPFPSATSCVAGLRQLQSPLCLSQGVECEYKDAQQPKIDPSTRLVLDRIQPLEEKLLSSPVFAASQASNVTLESILGDHQSAGTSASNTEKKIPEDDTDRPLRPYTGAADMSYPSSHTANANHVLNWPIVRQLLTSVRQSRDNLPVPESDRVDQSHGATDISFRSGSALPGRWTDHPVDTWRLSNDETLSSLHDPTKYEDLVSAFFEGVNVFFPLLSIGPILDRLRRITNTEHSEVARWDTDSSPAQYCLLLLVLCLGSFVHRGGTQIKYNNTFSSTPTRARTLPYSLDQHLWRKAQLLLGHASTDISIEAAQCTMLAR